jgi:predicted nucleic acid-binding protein
VTALVVDAAAFVEVGLRTPRGQRAAAVLSDAQWHVPAHFDVEVFSAYARLFRRWRLTREEARDLLGDLRVIGAIRHEVHHRIGLAWHRIDNLSPAGALYAELAASLDAPLVTCDAALAAQVPGAVLVE